MNAPTRDELSESNPDMLFLDDYDDCLLGVAMRYGMNEVAAYDYDKVIAKLVADGMTHEEALEWFGFNQIGAWMGDNTPVFVQVTTGSDDSPPTPSPSNHDAAPHISDTTEADRHHPPA